MLRAMLFVICLVPSAVLALTGQEYLERCEHFPAVKEGEAGMCLLYVAGAIDGARTGAHYARLATATEAIQSGGIVAIVGDVHKDLGVCFAEGVSVLQITAMLVKFLKENPNSWHYPAAETLFGMLRGSFPCPSED